MEGNLKNLLVKKDVMDITCIVDMNSNFWGVDFDEINDESNKEMQINKEYLKNNINVLGEQDIDIFSLQVKVNVDVKTDEILEDRLENIRLKYIVGKIVGEDLMDSTGTVIAIKNSLITEELINVVDEQGKLSELILNMMFQE